VDSKEVAIIATFAAAWAALQITLGPYIGRISIGPVSFHGTVNRLIGWYLMAVMSFMVSRFGRITLMASIAALITRIARLNVLEGLIVGAGYALGGLLFDILSSIKKRRGGPYYLLMAILSGFAVILPYWSWRMYLMTPLGFLILLPAYLVDAVKGVFLSCIGVSMAIGTKRLWHQFSFLNPGKVICVFASL